VQCFTVNQNLPLCRVDQTGDQTHQHRFAAAVNTLETIYMTGLHLHAYIFNYVCVSKSLCHIVNYDIHSFPPCRISILRILNLPTTIAANAIAAAVMRQDVKSKL